VMTLSRPPPSFFNFEVRYANRTSYPPVVVPPGPRQVPLLGLFFVALENLSSLYCGMCPYMDVIAQGVV